MNSTTEWTLMFYFASDNPLAPSVVSQLKALKNAGFHFRNQMEVGPGGRQIQLEDPDGNPIELFEPAQ